MASITVGVAPPGSPGALVVGHGNVGQSTMTTCGNKDSPIDMTPPSINPLLLVSACFGSLGAMSLLFSREDSNVAPMVMPTQAFLDLLNTSNTRTKSRMTVKQASQDIEDGIDQPALPDAAQLVKGVTIDGDTALHVVASHGDNTEFLMCASIINERDQDLLLAVNKKGDTPLHCAARAGKSKMVSCLVELAGNRNMLHQLLRKGNVLKETALHEAVRIGENDMVELLLAADPELANYPKEGASPLYVAILLGKYVIARTLHDKSKGNISYSGPNGQNALHVAILHGTVMIKDLLNWKNSLTTECDKDGSTPLHFASSLHPSSGAVPWQNYTKVRRSQHSNVFRQVFEANPTPVYQADNKGLFPIHVAASLGIKGTIQTILENCPSSAGLRNAKGGTFLHVAVEETSIKHTLLDWQHRLKMVCSVCQNKSLTWILNMQDNDGNTALHLAVEAGKLRMFCSLYRNKEVHLNLPNKNGQTPLDLSRSLRPPGGYHFWNSDSLIYMVLELVGAKHSCDRWDQIEEKYSRQLKPEEKAKEEEKMKDSSQILGIGSVLIATVAFGAIFAVPGGFIADDHTNRGTPTLAGTYTFDAFMMANALAFICSSIATVGLMFSGSPMVSLVTRGINLRASVLFASSSLTSMAAAFALGVYMVLAPVAHATAILICVLSPLVVLYRNLEFLLKLGVLAQPLYVRMGLRSELRWLARIIVIRMFTELWPYILIFGWPAIAQKIRNHV
ncbi:hypothetical protein ZWY2020_055025 [Hordeum vulgare]|nr:hypothetical protein ZWY2020_055025 [Hordeum vulgare]